MKLKKVIIVGNTASNLYLFRKDLIVLCVKEGYEIVTLVSEYSDEWINKIEDLGAKVITYDLCRGGINPLKDINSLLNLKKIIVTQKPDTVFCFFTKPVIYGSLAAKFAKVPFIIGMIEGLGSPFTEHPYGQSLRMKFIKFMQISLYRIVFPYLHKIIFLNKDDPIDLINENKIFTKKNAVQILGPIGLNLNDYPYQSWSNKKQISFIFVARLLAEKGIYEYIEAAKIIKSQYPEIIFKIIGGLDLENPYGLSKNELDQLVSSNLIEYYGFVNNVSEHLANSSVFVLPSYYREGVPRSTQEAMAIGRPVITTDVPGCRETVVDGLNGFLVPKWDAKALANKMCYFIEHPEQINVMGLESFKIAQEKFDANKINLKLLEIMGLKSKNEKIT